MVLNLCKQYYFNEDVLKQKVFMTSIDLLILILRGLVSLFFHIDFLTTLIQESK